MKFCLIDCVRNFLVCFQICNSARLPIIESKSGQELCCQPVPPESHDEEAAPLFELRLRQPRFPAQADHGLSPGTDPFDIPG